MVAQPSAPGKSASHCPSARSGLAFYRTRFSHHRRIRGLETPHPAGRKPRSCADAQYLAEEVWPTRAFRERKKTERHLKKMAELKRLSNRHPSEIALDLLGGDREQWDCLMYIVGGENKAMDPTLDFGGGHGNVYEAYGIPQANPGYKMASAGPDWRTNPETQLRWMIGYCKGRYGSVCGAAYARRTQGWY